MKTNPDDLGVENRALLSYLWSFVLFNILFRDIHEIPTREFLEQALTGSLNGVLITDELLLLGGLMIEVQILMILVSRFSSYRFNRTANLIVGPLTLVLTGLNNRRPDLDDLFFASIEIFALSCITWVAYKWKDESRE